MTSLRSPCNHLRPPTIRLRSGYDPPAICHAITPTIGMRSSTISLCSSPQTPHLICPASRTAALTLRWCANPLDRTFP
jgi:hypothetical protein